MISACFVEFTLFAVSKASFWVSSQLRRSVGVQESLGSCSSSARCASCARYASEPVDRQRSRASSRRSLLSFVSLASDTILHLVFHLTCKFLRTNRARRRSHSWELILSEEGFVVAQAFEMRPFRKCRQPIASCLVCTSSSSGDGNSVRGSVPFRALLTTRTKRSGTPHFLPSVCRRDRFSSTLGCEAREEQVI